MLRLFRIFTRVGIAALAAFTSACSAVTFGIANAPAAFGSYERTTDIAYGPGNRHRLDVYVPKTDAQHDGEARPAGAAVDASSPNGKPVVVFWYGGSWQTGDRENYRFVGAALAEKGFVAVLPDYRLYPEVKFPEFLDDGARAITWAQQYAQEFGGDPRHIVLMGHSAGAHIAAYLALNREFLATHGAKPEWIAGLVGLAGPYALEPDSRTLHTIFGVPYGEADWQPVRFVSREAPPTFLAHGLSDHVVAARHAEKLRDALRMNDVRVEAHLYPGKGHAAPVASFSVPARASAPTLDQAARFIESVTSSQTDPSR